MDSQPWTIERSTGSAQSLHDRDLRDLTAPTAVIHTITEPAVVLGSRQTPDVLSAATQTSTHVAGLEVTSRRSGGGLVVLEPSASLWIDLVLPRTHSRWDDDVNRSFLWVGELWQAALADLGFGDAFVHDGPLVNRNHGALICFAGLGPGEVLLSSPDQTASSKIVGLSQRRTRNTARFQCLAVLSWSPELLRSVVNPLSLPTDLVIDELQIGFPPGLTPPSSDVLADAVVARL